MWNRINLRMKITLLTTFAIALVTVFLTLLANYNVERNIVIPIRGAVIRNSEEAIDTDTMEVRMGAMDNAHKGQYEYGEIQIFIGEEPMRIPFSIAEHQRDFQIYSIVIATVFILLGAVGAYIISGQTLKPIKSLAQKMEDIDANNLTAQIEPPYANDEVSRLTESFNNMLGKLACSFETQKHFAQNAAHELKTPLTSIRASIEVLRLDDKPTVNDYEEMAEIVDVGTERLIELVEGLLSLNSASEKIKWQNFSVKEVFDNILNELSEEIKLKNLSASVSGDCRIKGDKILLGLAFFNLTHNAVRYNVVNGNVGIKLSDSSIVIEDSGMGIPAEHLPHIFEPFYCVDNSRSKKLGGHGLGMAIAKNILDSHEMKIHIESEPGKGTTVYVSIPQ